MKAHIRVCAFKLKHVGKKLFHEERGTGCLIRTEQGLEVRNFGRPHARGR